MRIDDDIRKCVAFFGLADDLKPNGIQCGGTGFFLTYDFGGYLVTAAHVAKELGRDPFLVRVNTKNGEAKNLEVDNARWYFHPDKNVDVALIPFHVGGDSELDVKYLPAEILADDNEFQNGAGILGSFGPGDLTYTVGLFQLLSGQKRNLPVVHSGSIALVPRDERIPVTDWSDKTKTVYVEGYLVETQALKGLSGAPVFVRRTLNFSPPFPRAANIDLTTLGKMITAVPQQIIHLLGVWQSSWEAPPMTWWQSFLEETCVFRWEWELLPPHKRYWKH